MSRLDELINPGVTARQVYESDFDVECYRRPLRQHLAPKRKALASSTTTWHRKFWIGGKS